MATESTPNFYEILGVARNATTDQIRSAYRELARENHPDSFGEARKAAEESGNERLLRMLEEKIRESEEKLKRINEAYETLSDPQKRERYDARLSGQTHQPQPEQPTPEPTVVPPDIRITKTMLDFGNVTKGEQKSDYFNVANVGGPVASYEFGWEHAPDWADAEAGEDPISVFLIRVTVTVDTSNASAGRHEAKLVVIADEKEWGTVTVSVTVIQPVPQPAPVPVAPKGQTDKQESALTFEDYIRMGDELAKQWKWAEAISRYSQAIQLEPRNARGYLSRGKAYGNTFEGSSRAISDYTEAIRLDPHNSEAYSSRARQWANNPEKALADYTQAIKLDPTNANAYCNRGWIYLLDGSDRKTEAIADYTEAIRLDPTLTWAYYGRASAYHSQGKLKNELRDLETCLRLIPQSDRLYNRAKLQRSIEELRVALAKPWYKKLL